MAVDPEATLSGDCSIQLLSPSAPHCWPTVSAFFFQSVSSAESPWPCNSFNNQSRLTVLQQAIKFSPRPFHTYSAQLLYSSDVLDSTVIHTFAQCTYVTHHGTNVASKGECCEVAVNILAILV